MDFGDCEKVGDALECLLQAYHSITGSKGKLLVLYGFDTAAVRHRDFVDQFREILKLTRFREKIEKAAAFGHNAAKAFDARCGDLRYFATRKEALDWLIS